MNKQNNQNKVSDEDISKKTAELTDLISNYEGNQANVASEICYKAVLYACGQDFYGALGVLTETLLHLREEYHILLNIK